MSCLHARGAWRRHSFLRRHAAAAAVLGAGLAIAGPALATGGAGITGLQGLVAPALEVKSDGSKYTELVGSLGPIQGTLLVEVEAGTVGRVKSWKAWPILNRDASTWDSGWEHFPKSGQSQSYGLPRPKLVQAGFAFAIPRADYATFMVQACNAHADVLRGQGKSNSAIFAHDRQVQIGVWGDLEYEITSIGELAPRHLSGQVPQFTLTCKGVPKPLVESAHLVFDSSQVDGFTGACALKLKGTIVSRLPNWPLKFHYVDAGGQQSDPRIVMTDAMGRASFNHDYPLSADIKSGRLRIVGSSHDFASDWVDFESDCGTAKVEQATLAVFGEGSLRGNDACSVTLSGTIRTAAPNTQVKFRYRSDDGRQSDLKTVATDHTATAMFSHEYPLPQGGRVGKIRIVGVMPDFTSDWADYRVQCGAPTQGYASGAGADTQQSRPGGSAIGRLAKQQAQTFAIQAPKGLVRQGEIRLSGGAANAKYTLKFLRKNGGGYVAVNAAQLPKQMTGLAASFPLKALTGGRDWRIEVCPEGGAPSTCKTADFRLTRIGGAGAANAPAPAPAPEQPQGTIFLVPGATQ